jgi:preprotein translocase subunit SecD
MQRRLWVSMIAMIVIVITLFVGNLVTHNTPILGLDLQGGVSVILAPVEPATGDDLVVIRDLIRSELENRGIAEPDVRVQGQTIVVDLPGVKDQQEALDAVDVSGVVELRPVVNAVECASSTSPSVSALPIEPDTGSTLPAESVPAGGVPAEVLPTGSVPTASAPAGFRSAPDRALPAQTVPPTTIAPATTTVGDTTVMDPTLIDPTLIDPTAVPATPTATGAELLATRDGGSICVGPAQGTGEVFERGSAEATLQDGWGVSVGIRGDGAATWNNLASQCYNTAPTCPSTQVGLRGQIAITLDSIVQSSPQVNQPSFTDSVAITGSFSESEARDLAAVLDRGAFPVEVKAQEARIVSASAGADSLSAAIVAGLIGLLLVLLFMVAYYRWLALVIVAGLTVWGLLVFSVSSLVSGWTNYSLGLAGVTGIIVSVGVTVDSYVVFFERIKDELKNGRVFKNAAPRSFASTWRTIWVADLVSIIGAVILFTLSVGSVRGFALYLGITTACDLIVCYFFTRPAVLLLASSGLMRERQVLGVKVVPA